MMNENETLKAVIEDLKVRESIISFSSKFILIQVRVIYSFIDNYLQLTYSDLKIYMSENINPISERYLSVLSLPTFFF